MNWLEVITGLVSGGIIRSLASDEQIYNDLGIKNQSLVNWERQQDMNNLNMRFQNRWNERTIQNEWDMFNATNAYNTPQAQMERYKAAGLNPNLIYGQSNMASPVSIPSMSSPKMESYASGDPMNYFNNIIGTIAQIPMVMQKIKSQKLVNDNLEQDNLIKRGMANYWAVKAQNEGYDSAEKMFKNMIWLSMNNHMQFSGQTDAVANAWFESLKEGLKTNGLRNKVLVSQEAYTSSRKKFQDLLNKYNEGFEGSKGLMEIERELKETLLGIKNVDLNFQKTMDFSKAANPFIRFFGSIIQGIMKNGF